MMFGRICPYVSATRRARGSKHASIRRCGGGGRRRRSGEERYAASAVTRSGVRGLRLHTGYAANETAVMKRTLTGLKDP